MTRLSQTTSFSICIKLNVRRFFGTPWGGRYFQVFEANSSPKQHYHFVRNIVPNPVVQLDPDCSNRVEMKGLSWERTHLAFVVLYLKAGYLPFEIQTNLSPGQIE